MSIKLRKFQNKLIVDINEKVISQTIINRLKKLTTRVPNTYSEVLINFSSVNKIKNSNIKFLIYFKKQLNSNAIDLSIFNVNSDLLMIFYFIKLDKYINIYSNEACALMKSKCLIKPKLKVV